MKVLVSRILVVLAALSTMAVGVYAAPGGIGRDKVREGQAVGPYEGTFHGYVYGDRGSKAPLTLELTHRGEQVEGDLSLDRGLYVDGGRCGAFNVPSGVQYASGQTLSNDPRRLIAQSTVDVGGFGIGVDLESDVSPDGETVTAQATIDLPWLCGRDPVLTGTLHRVALQRLP